ncbi:MAG TPA: GAF domain-containing protein, partial [Stellaceae bacterium]|nr:GAF domain-containing protein [Stellaceae bacterium]
MAAVTEDASADPARLVSELRRQLAICCAERDEAAARETAAAEVLQLINASPGDLGPVFRVILEKAHALCGIESGGLVLFDGEHFRLVANHAMPERHAENVRRPYRAAPGSAQERLLRGERFVHIEDVRANPTSPQNLSSIEAGTRTLLLVPLRKEGALLGFITSIRREVRPFSEKEIALLESFAAQAVTAMENARLLTETREALERQTATAEILRVISSSPTDVQPTFDAIAAAAVKLTGAASGVVCRFDGRLIHLVAHHGLTAAQLDAAQGVYPLAPGRGSVTARALLTRAVAHVADLAADPEFVHPSVAQAGVRTMLSVPMLRDGNPIGAITVARNEIEPFSDQQIDLLQTFADQAVIAIENVRLFNELNERTGDLQESLEYQTATSDVLKVISRSTFDLRPVLDTLVETAARLCGAARGGIALPRGEAYRYEVLWSYSPEWTSIAREMSFPPGRGTLIGRVLLESGVVHIPDVAADRDYAVRGMTAQSGTLLGVPMLREGQPIGVLVLARQQVEPFTERQIELVRTFADQAVIAIENTRLLTETREALEQQTATAEVLQVINSSPGDLAPVWDAMLEKAMKLCNAPFGGLILREGEMGRYVAVRNAPKDYTEFLIREPVPLRTLLGPALDDGSILRIADLSDTDGYRRRAPLVVATVELAGGRSVALVPMLKDKSVVGVIGVYRTEVRPFSDNEIALLQNFAAQAVIAMENARLLTETREALEKQTATAEILRVISSSPTDVQPTFDAIAASAVRICGAVNGGIFRFDGALIHFAAHHGWTPEELEAVARHFPLAPGRQSITARAILTREVAQVADIAADPEFALTAIAQSGIRATLSVPMLKDGAPLGAITVTRYTAEPFAEAQIDLLKTFADQAVIAIENVRLFNELNQRTGELQEALEYQTATSNVLQVISRSAFDLQRVLETLAESAAALAQSDTVFIFRREGEGMRLVAQYAPTPAFGQVVGNLTLGPDRRSTTGRAFLSGEVVRIANVQDEPDYQLRQSELDRIGSTMAAPLLRGGETVGVITLARLRVEPYSDRHVELVRTFADQAVIAMENARLLGELRERTRDLEESLEYQTATSDVLKVISHSTFDLQPVLDTVVETATRLCLADQAVIFRREPDGSYLLAANFGFPSEYEVFQRGRRVTPAMMAGSPTTLARAERE